MEVKIGVQNVAREISFESEQSPEEVSAAVETAVREGGLLTLRDARGRTIVVPAAQLGYVEIGESTKARVGFGSL